MSYWSTCIESCPLRDSLQLGPEGATRRYPTLNDPVKLRNGTEHQPLTLGGHTFEDIHRAVVVGTFAATRSKFAVTKTHILNSRAPIAKTNAGDESVVWVH